MDSHDSGSGAIPLLPLWGALGRRLAVATGAATALTALFFQVPVSAACLRGGMAWLLARAVAAGIGWLLVRVEAKEPEDEDREPIDNPAGQPAATHSDKQIGAA